MKVYCPPISYATSKAILIAIMILSVTAASLCQTGLPEVFSQGTIPEQISYIEEHTRIYENYRAIREDMFQTMNENTLDTLNEAKLRINGLITQNNRLEQGVDSVTESLEVSKNELAEMTRTKNSIRILGMEVNKVPYNAVMWTVIAALIFLLISGYLLLRQHTNVTLKTKKDLNELKEEFENYRTKTRLEREKTALNHFNEIKKLKGK